MSAAALLSPWTMTQPATNADERVRHTLPHGLDAFLKPSEFLLQRVSPRMESMTARSRTLNLQVFLTTPRKGVGIEKDMADLGFQA